ncbi:ATP-binding protein [Streptomyces sp. NPDC019890]|uniref:ATP-binding protein n=1 Tax=Streptomyces sp. NPDC019890 TaxID=3365064 RepID=UPI00384D1E8C
MPRRQLEEFPYAFKVPAAVEEVAPARRRIVERARHLGVVMDDELQGDLELVSGEVVANSITHTGAPCVVCVRWTGERLRVEVTDVDSSELSASAAGAEDESGRGLVLVLVDALATAWGTQPCSAGKTTWFELAARMAMTFPESAVTASSAAMRAGRALVTCTDDLGISHPGGKPLPISSRVLHHHEAFRLAGSPTTPAPNW